MVSKTIAIIRTLMNVSRSRFISASALLLLAFGSRAYVPDYQIQANIRYDQYQETVLDILQPSAPSLADRPGVIVIHGGGWVQGSKENMLEEYCLPFVRRGMVVANVEYRLASAAPAPAAVNDVLKAAQWFHDHAAKYKVDPKRILATGSSAGGHLALMTAMTPSAADLGPSIKIAAVVDFFGIADVPDQLDGPHQKPYAVAWIPEQPGRMELALRLSPIAYVRKGLPPVLALHGDADETVPYAQSVALVKGLKNAGDDAELITIPGGKHGFTPGEMNQLWPQIFQWMKKRKIG
jgi:acetyl esterase/lipase